MKGLTDSEAEEIHDMMIGAMTAAMPGLEEAIGTGLDPTSVVVGCLLAMCMANGRSVDVLEFLSDEKNNAILLALREKVQ